MNTTLPTPLMLSKEYSPPPRVLSFYTQDSRELAFHGVFLNITRFAYCFFTHRIPGKPFFICVFDNPIAFGRSEGAPSTITQYEYYSPLTPDGVQKLAGTPPRIVFLHTGFPGNPFSYGFLTIRLLSAVPRRGRPLGTAENNRIVKTHMKNRFPGILCVKKQYAKRVMFKNTQ